MARTKQTARKSTGGKAPRKMLAATSAFGATNTFGSTSGWGTTSTNTTTFGSKPVATKAARKAWAPQAAPSAFGSEISPSMKVAQENIRSKTVPVVPPAPATEEHKQLWREENRIRQLFVENRSSPELTKHVLLQDVFAQPGRFDFAPETPAESAIPKLIAKYRTLTESGPAIGTREQFERNWKAFSGGLFENFNWNNVFVAGGAVLACMQPRDVSNEAFYANSDIDLFVYGIESQQEATQRLHEIYNQLAANSSGQGKPLVIRTARAITVLGRYPQRHVQVILRLYKCPSEVLLGFDIDVCCFGYDGQTVWALERARRAVTKRYNLVDPTRRSLSYETRLAKYARRGYAAAVPDLDAARLGPIQWTPRRLQGLPKLLALDAIMRRSWTNRPMSQEQDSDYSLDVPRRAGLEYAQRRDKAAIFSRLHKAKSQAGAGNNTNAQPRVHQHVFVTSLDGVVSPEFGWCRLCREKKPLVGDDSNHTTPFVSSELRWIDECPVYQDFEAGQQRRLMIGSFQVEGMNPDWWAGAYADGQAAAATPSVLYPLVRFTNNATVEPVNSWHQPTQPVTSWQPPEAKPKPAADWRQPQQPAFQLPQPLQQSWTQPQQAPEQSWRQPWPQPAPQAAPAPPQTVQAFQPVESFAPPRTPPSVQRFNPARTPGQVSQSALAAAARPAKDVSQFWPQPVSPPQLDIGAFDQRASFAPSAAAAPLPDYGSERFVCERCGERCVSANQLRNHAQRAHGHVMPVRADAVTSVAPSWSSTASGQADGFGVQPGSYFERADANALVTQQPPPRRLGFRLPPTSGVAAESESEDAPSGEFDSFAQRQRAFTQQSATVESTAVNRVQARALFRAPNVDQLADVVASVATNQAKALLAVSYLFKCNAIDAARKQRLKLRAIRNDPAFCGAIQAFEVDGDVEELLDTVMRL